MLRQARATMFIDSQYLLFMPKPIEGRQPGLKNHMDPMKTQLDRNGGPEATAGTRYGEHRVWRVPGMANRRFDEPRVWNEAVGIEGVMGKFPGEFVGFSCLTMAIAIQPSVMPDA